MATVRLQIVDAVSARIAAVTVGEPYRNLDQALEDENLKNRPAVAVMSGPDGRSDKHRAPASGSMSVRDADVHVAILVAKSADPESAADAVESAIHAAIMTDTTLGGLALSIESLGGDWAFDLGDCCTRRLAYRITFRHQTAHLEAQ